MNRPFEIFNNKHIQKKTPYKGRLALIEATDCTPHRAYIDVVDLHN